MASAWPQGGEDVTRQLWICLCSYRTLSEGPAHSSMTDLSAGSEQNPHSQPGVNFRQGALGAWLGCPQHCRPGLCSRAPGSPAQLGTLSHLPANATTVCSLGSELALSESQEIFYLRGRAGMGEREEINQALGSVLAPLNAPLLNICNCAVNGSSSSISQMRKLRLQE